MTIEELSAKIVYLQRLLDEMNQKIEFMSQALVAKAQWSQMVNVFEAEIDELKTKQQELETRINLLENQ